MATNTLPISPLRLLGFCLLATALTLTSNAQPIDREALVTRHNPTATKLDPLSPFSVGNGAFAFTADITGLQTFPDPYDAGIPLHTQSQWGWHSFPNTHGYKLQDAFQEFEVHGRKVPYAGLANSPAGTWLRGNPHRLDLARIGLILKKEDGSPAKPDDLSKIKQTLDLWRGILTSEFEFDAQPVKIRTACHPQLDQLAVDVESPLLKTSRLSLSISFPGAKADWKENADWTTPDAHQTVTTPNGSPQSCLFSRTLDDSHYFVRAMWSGGAQLEKPGAHQSKISTAGADRLWFVSSFTGEKSGEPVPDASATFQASSDHWKKFWSTGGAIDLSGSTDP
ncbi:MAG: hypothetical protein V4819_09525, partial [Verrucomicrobiota bacterium]